MNWDAIAAVSALAGAVGVIASLVFIGIQVRQNTRAVRAATYDSLVTSSGTWIAALVEDPALAAGFEAAVEDWGAVPDAERARMNFLFTQMLRLWENVHFQHREGTLADDLWGTWEFIMASYFQRPGLRGWWQSRRMAYTPAFRDFLEATRAPEDGLRTTRQRGADA